MGLVNKVAQSGLITIKPEEFIPAQNLIREFDLSPFLFKGLLLREKEFRAALKEKDWREWTGFSVWMHCSTDAIIPLWAWMLVASWLQPHAHKVIFGSKVELERELFLDNLRSLNMEKFRGQRLVIKGCGDSEVPEYVYIELMNLLRPVAKSIFFGEPCSTVPLYKRKD